MYITIDIGGTSIRVALSKNQRTFTKKEKFSTVNNFKIDTDNIAAAIKKLTGGKKPKAVIIASAGVLDVERGRVIHSPNLKSWDNKPLTKAVAKDLGIKAVFLTNDADAAGLGEAAFGAGKGKRIVAFLTLSTGVGGTRIVNGQIDTSSQGFEPGYQIIVLNGRKSPHGQRGPLESYVSGVAGKKHPISWKKYSQYLGQGLVNVNVFWSPDIIVLGGGVTGDAKHFLKPAKEFVKKNSLLKAPPIVIGKLGDDAGLYGGLQYLNNLSP